MENNTFNIKRFWRYFVHDLLRCIRRAGLATFATGLIPVIMLAGAAISFASLGLHDWSLGIAFTEIVFAVVSVLYFLLTPISCYGELTDRKKGGNFLMLPASHTEKFISMLINSAVIFPAVFCLIYLGLDAICTMVFPSRYDCTLASWIVESSFSLPEFFLPVMVSAAGLCGALLFKRRKASKTFLTCAVSFIVLFLAMLTVLERNAGSTYGSVHTEEAAAAWYIFQAFCAICCLTYSFIKTKRIQL